jgi:hypothetical protein
MAKYVHKDAFISVAGSVLSDHAQSLTIEDSADEVDFTSFTSAGYKEIGGGLKDATITVTFFQDFAANSVHQVLQPLYASGGTFAVEVRPTSAVVSATNPRGTATMRLLSYAGFGGAVGDASTFDASFRNGGTAGLVWATT